MSSSVDGAWKVLEINSGVMMEALNQSHPELVDAAYGAALDLIFDSEGEDLKARDRPRRMLPGAVAR